MVHEYRQIGVCQDVIRCAAEQCFNGPIMRESTHDKQIGLHALRLLENGRSDIAALQIETVDFCRGVVLLESLEKTTGSTRCTVPSGSWKSARSATPSPARSSATQGWR